MGWFEFTIFTIVMTVGWLVGGIGLTMHYNAYQWRQEEAIRRQKDSGATVAAGGLDAYTSTFKIIKQPPTVGVLYLIPDTRDISIMITRWPSAWHRFWQYALLGFRYKKEE